MDLKKYDRLAEERDNAPVREYAAILAEKGYPQKLVDAIPRAEKALAAAQKLAARLQKDYPIAGNQNRPPWLQDHIGQLHNNYLRPLRERLASVPLRLRAFAEHIMNAKPADFNHVAPETYARLDVERAGSLLSEVDWLHQFPERVAAIEREIQEWLDSPTSPANAGQGSTPPAPAFAPRPLPPDHGDPNEPPAQWDSRDPKTFGK